MISPLMMNVRNSSHPKLEQGLKVRTMKLPLYFVQKKKSKRISFKKIQSVKRFLFLNLDVNQDSKQLKSGTVQ